MGIPAAFTGLLMTDGYTGYQHLLSRLAGIEQCCQHIIRRCRAVIKLGPGGLQSWLGDMIAILREAHQAVQDALRPRQHRPGRGPGDNLRQRYDEAAAFGIIHNRLRDWHDGNPPATRSAAAARVRGQVSCSPVTSPRTGPHQRRRARRQSR